MLNPLGSGSFLHGQRFIQLALLGGGLILSAGSAGTAKRNQRSSVTIVEPTCRASRPVHLEEQPDRYALSCRYNGGELESKFLQRRRMKGITCPKGTFMYGVVISCNGAEFDPRLLAAGKAARAAPASIRKIAITTAEKAAMSKALLDAHNAYRAELKLEPLAWSERLAELAQKWAGHVAEKGGTQLASSDPKATGQGENLWIGAAGAFGYADMVKSWGDQKMDFINDAYPRVSKSGNAALVRNYTQMIWGATTQVGCAIARAGKSDILVCRYWPPGNVQGQKPY